MWPFFARKKQQQNVASIPPFCVEDGESPKPRRTPLRFADLVNGMGGFGDFYHHDSALKFWLPEAANEALEEMYERAGISMSESLRQLFAAHCYGIYAYQIMIETNPGIFRNSEPMPAMFSMRASGPPPGKKRVETYWVPELGKNVMPVKVWIPKRTHLL